MQKGLTVLCCALLLIAALMGVGMYLKYAAGTPPWQRPTETETQPSSEPVQTIATEPTRPPVTEPTQIPTTEATEATEVTEPTEPPKPTGPVEESWYDDALFIGDSRTVGLRDYARLGSADYFCDVGMTVFDCRTRELSDLGFPTQRLESLLASKTYGKVLIGLGINECGYPIESFAATYASVVETIRAYQPEAVIVLQGIMTVGKAKAESADYFRPEHLFDMNERIAALADNVKTYYIDVNEVFADENGYLLPEASGDGVHLQFKYYAEWVNWISSAVGKLGL